MKKKLHFFRQAFLDGAVAERSCVLNWEKNRKRGCNAHFFLLIFFSRAFDEDYGDCVDCDLFTKLFGTVVRRPFSLRILSYYYSNRSLF